MNKFIALFFFLFSCSLQAQQNEIKIDVFGLLVDELNVSYEWLFSDKLGIEGGIGYIYSPERLDTITSNTTLIPGVSYRTIPFKSSAFSFLIGAKYYFSPNPKANRFFLGTFIQFRTTPKIEDAYFEAYEEYFNAPDRFTPNANLLVGISTGYKLLLFKQKIILEPILGLGLNIEESEFDIGGFGIAQELYLRLNCGYRF